MFRKSESSGQILQTCLEMIQDEGETLETVLRRFPEHADALKPELEAALWLRERRAAYEPRPGFVAASRVILVAQIRQESATPLARALWQKVVGFSRPHGWRKFAWQVALTLVLVALLLNNGGRIALASPTYLPGDALYPVKTGLESARLIVTPGTAGEARLYIEFARQRLMEIQALAFEGRYDEVAEVVDNLDEQVQKAVQTVNEVAERDPAQSQVLAAELKEALSTQTRLVLFLASIVPQETQLEFERVGRISNDAISAVQVLLSLGAGTPTVTAVFEVPSPMATTPMPESPPTALDETTPAPADAQ